MSSKTTLLLAVVFLGLAGGYFLFRTARLEPEPVQDTEARTVAVGQTGGTRKLVEEDIGAPVKVVIRRAPADEVWVFEKTDDPTSRAETWDATAPHPFKAVAWQVEGLERELLRGECKQSFRAGEPGAPTPEQAGLAPPAAVVTLTDAEDKSVTIEVGGPAAGDETYVRLAGTQDLCVLRFKLDTLIKPELAEYRQAVLWSFTPADAVRIEVVDRTAGDATMPYTIVRDGTQWRFQSPVSALASAKIDELVREMSRLRVREWVSGAEDRLASFGLAPQSAARTVRVVVRERVEPEKPEPGEGPEDDSEDAHPPDEINEPEFKETTYELHVSDVSPIGDEGKVHVRAADESFVGTITRVTADHFRPNLTAWRDMRVTTVDVKPANRIEITGDVGATTLVRKEGSWRFESDDSFADDKAVGELLDAVSALKATAFIDDAGAEDPEHGLDTPRVSIRLTVPGHDEPERITVGAPTDTRAQRLLYVRRNESTSLAKVRAQDLEKLLRGPLAYHDRVVFNIPATGIEEIELDVENRYEEGRLNLAFARADGQWRMVRPVEADVDPAKLQKLVDGLASLRAEAVVARSGEETAYGLQAPSAIVTASYLPPKAYRFEPPPGDEDNDAPPAGVDDSDDDGGDPGEDSVDDERESADGNHNAAEHGTDGGAADGQEDPTHPAPKTLVPVEYQPPSRVVELQVALHDGQYYARKPGAPAIYQLSKAFGDPLFEEFRTDSVLSFDPAEVAAFASREGDQGHTFERGEGDAWRYAPEPDWPVDAKKIENLLLQIHDLHTTRYVAYDVTDLTPFGLDEPVREVRLTLRDGTTPALLVSAKPCLRDTGKGQYACREGERAVFLLAPASLNRFHVSPEELEAKAP
jgi:hypothetical protein